LGTAEIGELLPNCTIPAWQMKGFVTTAEAISDLPPVEAGEEASHYDGPPLGPSQTLVMSGPPRFGSQTTPRATPASATFLLARIGP
jgi:hypothetical protein